MKKKIIVLVVTLLMCLSSISIITDVTNVEASGGEGSDNADLDYEYLKSKIIRIANVIRDAYTGDDIRKGRFMGSKGGNYTCFEILKKAMDNMNLENVRTEKIEQIGDEKVYYNRLLEVIGYNLTVNNDTYEFSNDIPKSEVFPIPKTIKKPGDNWFDYVNDFDNVTILHQNFRKKIIPSLWFNSIYNVTKYNILNDEYDGFIGKLEYITEEDQIPDTVEQQGKAYLLDWDSDSQEIIDNLTYASGIVLINISQRTNLNLSNNSYQINEINKTEGDYLINITQNNNDTIIDTISFENVTTYYNFNYSCLPDWGYVVIDRIPNHIELKNDNKSGLLNFWKWAEGAEFPNLMHYLDCYCWWASYFLVLNNIPGNLYPCKGIILYSTFDHHIMIPTFINWDLEHQPSNKFMGSFKRSRPMATFCVNESLGIFLNSTREGNQPTTISGDINQKFFKGTDEKPGVVAHNVIGELNIDKSPDDKYVIISNRYDGMWGETPGDSGIGTAMVLALARYQKNLQENLSIDPKYNITYLFTTGEEIGFRGAYFHRENLSEDERDKIHKWIGFDQLGMNQSDVVLNPELRSPDDGDNASIYREVIWVIANSTDYENKSGYGFEPSVGTGSGGAEDYVWSEKICDTLVFGRDNCRAWDRWHAAGQNYGNGDSLNYTDFEDAEFTYELAWEFVKYTCYNPDSWLTNVSFEAFDSPKDGDYLDDSIRANFTLNTVMPNDLARIKVNISDGDNAETDTMDYEVNSSGLNCSYSFTIPDDKVKGNYSVKIFLYNSTGRINEIIDLDENNYDDTSESDVFTLYHPFGCTGIGDSAQTVHDKIVGSVFTTNKNGYADNITAFINKVYMSPGPYTCMLYRKNDSKLIGTTEDNWTNRDYENGSASSSGWAVFNFSEPKPVLFNNTEYVITCWGNNSYSELYYKSFDSSRGRHNDTIYGGSPPDTVNFTNHSRLYSIYCSYTPLVEINEVSTTPNTVGFGYDVTINAEFDDPGEIIDDVKANVSNPDNSWGNFTMNGTGNGTYEYVFSDTWLVGQYNYSIWAEDIYNNTYSSYNHSFNVSSQGSISVCTIKDEYGDNEIINLTDPPGNSPTVGYEFLDDGKVLRIWNDFDSYYFNASSGIQLTNHYDEYWSHNVLMLGYYNNDEWNLIYRTDELSGFNYEIDTDNDTYVNVTLWKNLEYQGYAFRLAIRYYLGVDDNELTVIPYIKNIDEDNIPYVLGFGWEMNDIQIDMTEADDYIYVNQSMYYLNQTLDNSYTNLSESEFYLMENITDSGTKSLYLKWNSSLTYKLQVKSSESQYNAPVTLFVRIGTLNSGQEKYTKMYWYDANQEIYYFNSFDNKEHWANNPGYMVDGSTSNFASTSVDGQVELCNGNTCPGTDLGSISKVELRVHGYYSGDPRDIILRPVFGGTTDGSNSNYQATPYPDWSQWFEISIPTAWSWSGVVNLDCDVETGTGMFPSTVYASKVEIRVTYNPNVPPEISNPYPADGSIGIPLTPTLNITIYDNESDQMDITWLSNSSGSWQVFGTNNSVYNGVYHQVFSNATENGKWWYWKVNVTDGTNYTESDVFKFYTGYQSKINNTGTKNFKGYLLIQVQYYNSTSENWTVVDDTVNENTSRTVFWADPGGTQGQNILALDAIFNGLVNTSNLSGYGDGTYRIYAAFRDPDGNVLVCDDETELETTYEFTITF